MMKMQQQQSEYVELCMGARGYAFTRACDEGREKIKSLEMKLGYSMDANCYRPLAARSR
jgi:hypothetical protein